MSVCDSGAIARVNKLARVIQVELLPTFNGLHYMDKSLGPQHLGVPELLSM